jgi:hypothetical protein
MDENAARNEMKVMVVVDLAAICKELAENAVVPDDTRAQARELVGEFELLLPARGKGTTQEHFFGERLLFKMARFLEGIPNVPSLPDGIKIEVLGDLAASCKKLVGNAAVTDDMRQARELVGEFESLPPAGGTGATQEHFLGGNLLFRMARYFEGIPELQSWPARA